MSNGIECTRCGACCVAPDIAALDKPLGARCPHLGPDLSCRVYADRPPVCRSYEPDELCQRIEASSLDERVRLYLAVFGLEDEARRVESRGLASMTEARRLSIVRS